MSIKETTDENLQERFDDGLDVLDYFDLDHAERPNGELRRVNVDSEEAA